jgi:glutaminase
VHIEPETHRSYSEGLFKKSALISSIEIPSRRLMIFNKEKADAVCTNMAALKRLIDDVREELLPMAHLGKVADYIPELAKVDPKKFAISITNLEGATEYTGDALEPFSIQSISKVFALTLALGRVGDSLWARVGREPSGTSFNSIVQLEHERGIPRNPFINAGAIVVSDIILAGHKPREAIGEILRFVRAAANDESIAIDPAVAKSERETGFRNFALASYMRAFGNVKHPVELTLGVYFHQCAIEMTACQLSQSGMFLAAGGRDPQTDTAIVSKERARRINALMLTCGQYDASGDFAFRVGLPAKSGVGGGIIAIVPGRASIAVWSPGLNNHGNSLLGTRALELIAARTGWSVFGP